MRLLLHAAILLGLGFALLPERAFAAARPTPLLDDDPASGPKSVFVVEPGVGKDPFFPNSTRTPRPKTNDVVQPTPPPPPMVPEDIFLKGINLMKDRRFAIINHYTVAPGEQFDLKLKGKVYPVVCVEIKERSVIVSVNGATKELYMRPGL